MALFRVYRPNTQLGRLLVVNHHTRPWRTQSIYVNLFRSIYPNIEESRAKRRPSINSFQKRKFCFIFALPAIAIELGNNELQKQNEERKY